MDWNWPDSGMQLGDFTRYQVARGGQGRGGVIVVPDPEQMRRVVGELVRRAHAAMESEPLWVGVGEIPEESIRFHTGAMVSHPDLAAEVPARLIAMAREGRDTSVVGPKLVVVQEARRAFELARDGWEVVVDSALAGAFAVMAVVPSLHLREFDGSKGLRARLLEGTVVHFGMEGAEATVAEQVLGLDAGAFRTDARTAVVFQNRVAKGTWTL